MSKYTIGNHPDISLVPISLEGPKFIHAGTKFDMHDLKEPIRDIIRKGDGKIIVAGEVRTGYSISATEILLDKIEPSLRNLIGRPIDDVDRVELDLK